jgi:hypothetical protein
MRRVPSEGVGETNARFDFAELPGRMEWIAVRGIAVTIAERVAALAQPGEVIVSSTVKDVVAGWASNSRSVESTTLTECRAPGDSSPP